MTREQQLLEVAKKTNGHMPEHQLYFLAGLCRGLDRVLEFGSYEGRSSIAIASTAKDVFCIDAWNLAEFPDVEKNWLKNTKPYKNIHQRKGNLYAPVFKRELMMEFGPSADLIFIDAAHDYESVCSDIDLALILLKDGGILCGHDYTKKFKGVIQAVEKKIPKYRVEHKIWIREL